MLPFVLIVTCINYAANVTYQIGNDIPTLAGSLFGDSWTQHQTEYTVSSSSSPAALQALLRWFYTSRLDVPFDAVPVCLELCQQVQLTDLAEEAILALHSEGTTILSITLQELFVLTACEVAAHA